LAGGFSGSELQQLVLPLLRQAALHLLQVKFISLLIANHSFNCVSLYWMISAYKMMLFNKAIYQIGKYIPLFLFFYSFLFCSFLLAQKRTKKCSRSLGQLSADCRVLLESAGSL
jgi:hypothetical protein